MSLNWFCQPGTECHPRARVMSPRQEGATEGRKGPWRPLRRRVGRAAIRFPTFGAVVINVPLPADPDAHRRPRAGPRPRPARDADQNPRPPHNTSGLLVFHSLASPLFKSLAGYGSACVAACVVVDEDGQRPSVLVTD